MALNFGATRYPVRPPPRQPLDAVVTLETLTEEGLFICPRCASSVRPQRGCWRCSNSTCRYAKESFPVVSGRPALVDFENSILDAGQLRASEGASVLRRRRKLPLWVRRLTERPNHVAPVAVARMVERLRADPAATYRRPRILVVGGGAVGSGLESLYDDPTIELIAFDVYASPVVHFIGDGHAIPLADGSVDGVIVQSVLSYVLEPWIVAHEVFRVLRENGIVFADCPFMQRVVEGPCDFARFTDSGLRYLFRGFERIDSGAVAGVGTALMWSLGSFARALTRSVTVGRLVQLGFFWLGYLDAVLDPKHSVDAASAVFFLGAKAVRPPITQANIVGYYQGGFVPQE